MQKCTFPVRQMVKYLFYQVVLLAKVFRQMGQTTSFFLSIFLISTKVQPDLCVTLTQRNATMKDMENLMSILIGPWLFVRLQKEKSQKWAVRRRDTEGPKVCQEVIPDASTTPCYQVGQIQKFDTGHIKIPTLPNLRIYMPYSINFTVSYAKHSNMIFYGHLRCCCIVAFLYLGPSHQFYYKALQLPFTGNVLFF